MNYLVVPHESVGPLHFGFTQPQVAQEIGSAQFSSKNRYGNAVEYRNSKTLTCIYDKTTSKLVEVNFSSPNDAVVFDGFNIWNIDFSGILKMSKRLAIYQGFGSVVILELGVALTGFFPQEEEIKAISVFSKGRWDDLLSSMKRLT